MRLRIPKAPSMSLSTGIEELENGMTTDAKKAEQYLQLNETLNELRLDSVPTGSQEGLEAYDRRTVSTESIMIAAIAAASALVLAAIYKIYTHFAGKNASDDISKVSSKVDDLPDEADCVAALKADPTGTAKLLKSNMALYCELINVLSDRNGLLIGFATTSEFIKRISSLDSKLRPILLGESTEVISNVITKDDVNTARFKTTYDNVISVLQKCGWEMPKDWEQAFTVKDKSLFDWVGEYNYVKGVDLAYTELSKHLRSINSEPVVTDGQLAKMLKSQSIRENILICKHTAETLESDADAIAKAAKSAESAVDGLKAKVAQTQDEQTNQLLATYIEIIKASANVYKHQNLINISASKYLGTVAETMAKTSTIND